MATQTMDALCSLKIAEHCAFNAMQSNPAANYSWWDSLGLRDKNETTFLRKGSAFKRCNEYLFYSISKVNVAVISVCNKKKLIIPQVKLVIGTTITVTNRTKKWTNYAEINLRNTVSDSHMTCETNLYNCLMIEMYCLFYIYY